MDDHDHRIELADAIEAIRTQLVDAAARGTNSDLAFEVGDIHLEFEVQLNHDRTVKGGVKAWVLAAGYEAARGRTETQRVSVTLSPKHRGSNARWDVSNPDRARTGNFGPTQTP
ncbi:trypco2 family protein [Streptacidiphilus rugosus]|uniref:trypco2 family protein n=1 Tax=Streptacidiphilus rugosus TaxID=405783 RepID=UPI00055DD37E|nr:trypco2 family protein [Streptacidiphilus rugosus]